MQAPVPLWSRAPDLPAPIVHLRTTQKIPVGTMGRTRFPYRMRVCDGGTAYDRETAARRVITCPDCIALAEH